MVYGESRRADLVVSHDLTAPTAPRILQGGRQLCEDLEKVRVQHNITSSDTSAQ